MNSTPKLGVRARMIDEIKAEIGRQELPEGAASELLDQLTTAVVEAYMGQRNGRFDTDKKAAESIVIRLQQLVR